MDWKHLLWIVPLVFVIGALSYGTLNYEANQVQSDAMLQSIIVLAAYENAMDECMNFETRMCVVQGKNERYLELLQVVYDESEFESWSRE